MIVSGFGRQVRRDDGEQVRVTLRLVDERVRERLADRAAPSSRSAGRCARPRCRRRRATLQPATSRPWPRPPLWLTLVPENSGNGSATLTSGAEEGQAGAARAGGAATARASPLPRSWPACSRSAPRSPATSRRATTSTTPPTRTCCAARSPSARSWRVRASAAWGRRSWPWCEASRRVAPANTNLGIALLLAPLAKAALAGGPLRAALAATLRALDVRRRARRVRGDPPGRRGRAGRAGRARRALGAGHRPARGDGGCRRARLGRLRVRDRLRADVRAPAFRRSPPRSATGSRCVTRSSSCTCGCWTAYRTR